MGLEHVLARSAKADIGVILSMDPALDKKQTKYEKYFALYDESALVLLPGQVPTRFFLRELTPRARIWIDTFSSSVAREFATMRYAVKRIENGGLPEPEREYNAIIEADIITQAWVDKYFAVPFQIVNEIGEHARAISDTAPFLSKLSKPPSGDGASTT